MSVLCQHILYVYNTVVKQTSCVHCTVQKCKSDLKKKKEKVISINIFPIVLFKESFVSILFYFYYQNIRSYS